MALPYAPAIYVDHVWGVCDCGLETMLTIACILFQNWVVYSEPDKKNMKNQKWPEWVIPWSLADNDDAQHHIHDHVENGLLKMTNFDWVVYSEPDSKISGFF